MVTVVGNFYAIEVAIPFHETIKIFKNHSVPVKLGKSILKFLEYVELYINTFNELYTTT